MKKFLVLLLPVMLLFAGCSQSVKEPTSPTTGIQKPIIHLPAPNSLNSELPFSVSEEIQGDQGGMIKMNESYSSESGQVTIDAKLKIPKNAFSGTLTIGYRIDGYDASIEFSPGMAFNQDLLFDVKFTGLDLSGLNPDEVKFQYLDPDGITHTVQYSSLTLDTDKGTLELKAAEIPHFSRYIWAR